MDLLLPLPIRISKITPTPIGNAAAGRSIFSGAARTLSRSGDRFGWDITVTGASDRESFPMRAALRNIRSVLRGQANRIWFVDPSYKLRGSFPTGELLLNGTFQGSSAWGTSGSTLAVADGYARVQNSGAASGYIVNASALSLAVGASYTARAFSYPGTTSLWQLKGGTTSGANGLFDTTTVLTATGLSIQSFTAAAANFFFSLMCRTAVSGDFIHYQYASVSRCPIVNGGSQTGSNLNIQGLPASTAALLLPGDRVQVSTQLNEVAAPLNSDGSGLGYLQCALPWRGAPFPNGTPIIVSNPMARCILTSTSGWDESPGGVADFQFSIEESLDQ